jgi:hypothetical protein
MYARLDICLNLRRHAADSHVCDVSISHGFACRHACITICMLHVHVCLYMSTTHRYRYVACRQTCDTHASLYVCVHNSVSHVHMHASMYVIYACICIHTLLCMSSVCVHKICPHNTCMCITRMYVFMHVCYVCMNVRYVCACMCLHIHTLIYM